MIDLKEYPHLVNRRVKFFTRSFSLELYRLSKGLYEEVGIPCVRLVDQTANGYFLEMLRDTECDVAINVDEDCFITDLQALLQLADWAIGEGWVNVGCSDNSLGCPRGCNSIVTNPFLNIFNLEEIRTRWEGRIPPLDYPSVRTRMEQAFLAQMNQQKERFGFGREMVREDLRTGLTNSEPYYPFFFWLLDAFPGRTFYLNNRRHEDQLSTCVYDLEGKCICMHTWFARFYHPSWLTYCFEGSEGHKHTQRIDAIIDQAYAKRGIQRPQFGPIDQLAFVGNSLMRWTVKVPQRVAGWPRKIIQKIKKTSK